MKASAFDPDSVEDPAVSFPPIPYTDSVEKKDSCACNGLDLDGKNNSTSQSHHRQHNVLVLAKRKRKTPDKIILLYSPSDREREEIIFPSQGKAFPLPLDLCSSNRWLRSQLSTAIPLNKY